VNFFKKEHDERSELFKNDFEIKHYNKAESYKCNEFIELITPLRTRFRGTQSGWTSVLPENNEFAFDYSK
jgi:hypothetical protein